MIVKHKETGAHGRIVRIDAAQGVATVRWDKYATNTPNVPLAELDPIRPSGSPVGWAVAEPE